jgi:hypothetical protein
MTGGMYGDIHDKVSQARLDLGKQRASDICIESDLVHMENLIDDVVKEGAWDLNDSHTKVLVNTFKSIKEKFEHAKRIIERARLVS